MSLLWMLVVPVSSNGQDSEKSLFTFGSPSEHVYVEAIGKYHEGWSGPVDFALYRGRVNTSISRDPLWQAPLRASGWPLLVDSGYMAITIFDDRDEIIVGLDAEGFEVGEFRPAKSEGEGMYLMCAHCLPMVFASADGHTIYTVINTDYARGEALVALDWALQELWRVTLRETQSGSVSHEEIDALIAEKSGLDALPTIHPMPYQE
ncbi:MAG: hypothetical protein RhofKO_19340 [Rhodothermales bacterium]